jgi:hypothetical protein
MLHVDRQLSSPTDELKVLNPFTLAKLFKDLPEPFLGLRVNVLNGVKMT